MGADDNSDSVQQVLSEHLIKVDQAIDSGLSAASDAVRSGTAVALEEVEKATGFAKKWLHSAEVGLKQADNALIGTLRDGVKYALDNESITMAVGATAVVLMLPTTRRILWRATLGRFWSAEAAQRAVEHRVATLAESISSQSGEAEKLMQRLAMAREEYERGLSKLGGAASELRNLSGRVDTTQRKAQALMADLRELRSKHALQLRSDVAVKASIVTKQRAALEKVISGLDKEGL